MVQSPSLPSSSKGPGRSRFKAKTGVRIPVGAQTPGAPICRRSSPIYGGSGSEKQFESPQVDSLISDVQEFLAGLRFEKRNLLDELPINLKM